MKFTVSSTELLHHLQIGGGAIASNPVLPVLEDFLFTLEGDKLKISSTNLETSISTVMEVNGEEPGRVAVPAKILIDTLKGLPEQPVTLAVDEEIYGIEITSAYGRYKLAGDPPDEFPALPVPDQVESVNMNADMMLSAINKTLFATSNDELRLAMTGVFFQVDFNQLTVVATDAHKLVKCVYTDIQSDQTANFIVPKKTLNLLKSALPTDVPIKMSFNNNNTFFEFEDTSIACRLIDARYPDYNAVIPTDNDNRLLVGRQDLLSSLKRIAIYANKTTNQVVLNLSDGSMTVSAQDLDFSNEATEQIPCSYTGDNMNIGFNARFLVEMLSVLSSDEVQFELSSPNRASLLTETDKTPGEDLLMLVMPVMMSH